jgi:tRNA1(Val) A37 N6-methylase TrmN6
MKKINDVLGYSNMKIIQDSDYFSFSLDSIILANYSKIRLRDKKIVDFCTGNGVVPLILTRRCDKTIDAVEIQENVYELAKESVGKEGKDG